jgi:hypothetical protein
MKRGREREKMMTVNYGKKRKKKSMDEMIFMLLFFFVFSYRQI